jgi:hypothetical protein
MQNQFYRIIDTIVDEARTAGFTNVTFGSAMEIDLEKQSTFPIAHIILPTATQDEKTTTFTISIIGADLVDFTKDYETIDPLNIGIDNVQDVLQDILAKLQQIVQRISRIDLADIQYSVGYESFKEQFANMLAGWTLTVDITVPNLATPC